MVRMNTLFYKYTYIIYTRLERQGWKIAFLFRTLMRWKFNVDIYTDGRYRVFYFSLYDARNALNIKILLAQSRWDKLSI